MPADSYPVICETVVIISQDPRLTRLPDLLWAEGLNSVTVRTPEELKAMLERPDPSVAIVDQAVPGVDLTQIESLLERRKHQATLWLLDAFDTEADLKTPARSMEDFVRRPTSAEELVHRTKALIVRAGHGLPTQDTRRAARATSSRKRLVAVFSNKGGVGKSTLAVNLAVGLARLYGRNVLLADADLWYGDVGVLLDIKTRHSFYDICLRQMNDLDSLLPMTAKHPTGISVLLRPPEYAVLEKLNTDAVPEALRQYATIFDYVVVNMSPAMDELNLQILDVADRILLVTTPELPAANNTMRFLQVAQTIGYAAKTQLIVNRADSGIAVQQLEQTVGFPVSGRLVSAGRLVVEAANQGTSLFIKDPGRHEDITRSLAAIVQDIAEQPVPTQRRRGVLSFLRPKAA